MNLIRFAGRCLALDENPGYSDNIRDKLSSGEVSTGQLIGLCSNHLVLPALYLKFRSHGLLDLFPDAYNRQLQEIYELNLDSNLKILRQVNALSALLHGAGIPHVYLKGTGNLLGGIYSDAGERMIGDIDFLVHEKDFFRATEILERQGYHPMVKAGYADFLPPDHHHYPRLIKKGEPATVEVHRLPVKAQYAKQLTTEMVFEECCPVEGNPGAFVPSFRHMFILNFIHTQLSDAGHRRMMPSLRGLYDGYLLWGRINSEEIPAAVRAQTRLRIYSGLLEHIFHSRETFPDRHVTRYIRNFSRWQQHPAAHHIWLRANRFVYLAFGAYLGTILKSVYSKSYRRYTLMRLRNPQWYKQHFLNRKKQLFAG